MSTAARKARKRAGISFVHPVKVKNSPHPAERKASKRSTLSPGQFEDLVMRLAAGDTDEAKAERNLPLDPKPYRVGRYRYTIEQFNDTNEVMLFSPRKQYQQDEMFYA